MAHDWHMRLLLVATLCAVASLSMPLRAASADDRMEWQFSEFNDPDNKGRMTASLTFGVPETDAIQVSGVCGATSGTGAKFSSVTFGADVGKLENGKQVDVRFSGGGFDHVLQGQVHRAEGEEGLSGVNLAIGPEDPLWRAMADNDSLDYLVPGYKASTLNFERGKDKIQQFLKACRTYAERVTPQSNDQAPSQPADAGGNGAEKEAFDSAKELGTIEAWEAFLSSYPSGFHADLARAYVKSLGENAAAPMQAPEVKASPPAAAAAEPKPSTAKKGCGGGSILLEGKCIRKEDAAGYCGPGYRVKGSKCVFGYVKPKPQKQRPSWQNEAIKKGCPPGQDWNAAEGCHEND